MVQGLAILIAAVVVLVNLVVDLLYPLIDPRIGYGRTRRERDADRAGAAAADRASRPSVAPRALAARRASRC